MTINIYITRGMLGGITTIELTLQDATVVRQTRRTWSAKLARARIASWLAAGHEIAGGEANERAWAELRDAE